MSWKEAKRDKNGRLSTQQMISEVANGILIRSRAPSWLYKFGFEKFGHFCSSWDPLIKYPHSRLSDIEEAYNEFVKFMHERIAERETEIKGLRAVNAHDGDVTDVVRDVFGRLVAARLSEGKYVLSDDEIIGNCFVLVCILICASR